MAALRPMANDPVSPMPPTPPSREDKMLAALEGHVSRLERRQAPRPKGADTDRPPPSARPHPCSPAQASPSSPSAEATPPAASGLPALGRTPLRMAPPRPPSPPPSADEATRDPPGESDGAEPPGDPSRRRRPPPPPPTAGPRDAAYALGRTPLRSVQPEPPSPSSSADEATRHDPEPNESRAEPHTQGSAPGEQHGEPSPSSAARDDAHALAGAPSPLRALLVPLAILVCALLLPYVSPAADGCGAFRDDPMCSVRRFYVARSEPGRKPGRYRAPADLAKARASTARGRSWSW